MTDEGAGAAWFAGVDPADETASARAVREGAATAPADWPERAVAAGVVDDAAAYYDLLRAATLAATRAAVRERERADDQQLAQAVRAMDDCATTANELAERATEWGRTLFDGVEPGVAGARDLAAREPEGPAEAAVVDLAERVVDLDDEATALREYVERSAPTVAPNLAAMAGPVLTARLIALAGGLEDLARGPSGTLQVLGAEDALFAHLRGDAPSPKHGVIYTHEAVRGTRPADRGSAARALAGKLTIAARVDHYSGDRRPELDEQLADRIDRIRAREGGDGQ
jgi:nucleolar protein 56